MTHHPHPLPAFRAPRPPDARRRAAPAKAAAAPCRGGEVRLADIGQLAASIAHEVDQPLAAIALHAQAALRCIERAQRGSTAADASADGARAALRALLQASSQASDIVSSMRALAGTARTPRIHCRLDHALADVLAPYAADLERLGIDCRVSFGRGARAVPAHPVQLRQLLRNLVANAIDALRAVHGRARTLRIGARLDGAGALLLTVRDNGIGMDADQALRVFEPRVTTKASGLGLGLAICRAIATAHGGRIWAAPLAARGCEFSCLLPHDAPFHPVVLTSEAHHG